MMRWAYGIGVALGCLAAACLLPELRGLAGDGADASTLVDGSSGDANVDGSADGAVDVGPDVPRAPCPDSSFCDDFDQGALGARWSAIQQLDGVLTLEEGGLSAPNRLRMDLLAPKGGTRRAGLQKLIPIPSGITRVVCTMSLRVDVRPTATSDDYQILEVTQRDGARTSTYVKIGPTQTMLIESRPTADGGTATSTKTLATTAGGVPTGSWAKITLDVNTTTKTSTLSIVDATNTAAQFSTSIFAGSNNKTLELYLGEPDDGDIGLSTTQFDDFRCDFTP